MFELLKFWYKRYFTDPQASFLIVFLLLFIIAIFFVGEMLAPIFSAIVLSYLLEAGIQKLQYFGVTRFWSVFWIFALFVFGMIFAFLGLLPVVMNQLSEFLQELPDMINNGQTLLLRLPEQYPEFISPQFISEIISLIKTKVGALGQNVLSSWAASIPALITILVYLLLVPVMIFFFLKDKDQILIWLRRFLPQDQRLITDIWDQMDAQIGNYVRGKINEMFIVGLTTFIFFSFMAINYAPLLSILVGGSVLIPYLGCAVITIPITLVAYFQWGFGAEFTWILLGYLVIQFIDGNILVPILFSETVNLHPISIIVAILVFGYVWGLWGVFFAIPLAVFIKILLNVWPKTEYNIN